MSNDTKIETLPIDAIIPQLESLPDWKRPSHRIDRIESNIDRISKNLVSARQCKNILQSFLDTLPLAKETSLEIFGYFETLGLWTPSAEDMVNRMEKTLQKENLIDIFTEAILMGCECRKGITKG